MNLETIRESYVNTINEMNQELSVMKEQCQKYDPLDQMNILDSRQQTIPS